MQIRVPALSAATGAPVSDEFNSAALDTSVWQITNPVGDGAVSLNGAQAQLSVPAGRAHDLWTGGNESVRILQPIADGDLYVEAKFVSAINSGVQDQGLIVAQDPGTYVRFDVYNDGSAIHYFVASFIGNQPTVRASATISAAKAPYYLRVRRSGNQWTGYWSLDGANFAIGASFSFVMQASAAGPFAANNSFVSSSAVPAFTASVDYFHSLDNVGNPIPPPSPNPDLTVALQHTGAFVTGSQGTYTLQVKNAGTAATSGVISVTDTLPAQLSAQSVSGDGWTCQISGLAVECNNSVSIPPGASAPPITMTVNVTGSPGTVANIASISGGGEANVANNFASDPTVISAADTAAGQPITDEFNTNSLNTLLWTFVNPLGDGSVSSSGTQALLTVPAGTTHDLWTSGNQSARILQPFGNTDFYVEMKFDSALLLGIQDQGLIVAQDAANYVRFDVYTDGSTVRFFSASFINNQPVIRGSTALNNSGQYYLRVRRTADRWTGYWSTDGINYSTGVDFAFPLTASQIGPFAANNGSAPAFTAKIDYFRNLNDGVTPPPPSANSDLVLALQHSGTFQQGSLGTYILTATNTGAAASSGLITVADTLSAGLTFQSAAGAGWSCQASGQTVNCSSSGAVAAGGSAAPITLIVNITAAPGSVTNAASIAGGAEINTINNTATDTVVIAAGPGNPPGQEVTSDDFHSNALNTALWQFVNPRGDGSISLDGTHANLHVPAGSSHDVWTSGNASARIMQNVANGDFDVVVKFDSAVDLPCQTQGLIVEEDTLNYLRFDVYSDGPAAHLFAASFTNNSPNVLLNKSIGESILLPFYLRVRRTGNTFTYFTSTNGTNYTQAVQFTKQLTVKQIGPYGGNNACGYTAPAFTASVDYFFNSASPIVAEDGVTDSNPVIDFWYGDNQTFGQNGIPQKWVNVLGTALSLNGPLRSLTYTLNGGSPQSLWIGPDVTRLNQPGDFNVEISYTDLRAGTNTVVVTATDEAGNKTSRTAKLNYVAGKTWPLPYTINWRDVGNVQDAVQVVDGKWTIEPDGTVRTQQIGYDRLLNLGDMSQWKNYVVTAETTIHYINDDRIAAPPSHTDNVFGIGILVGWGGHTRDVFGQYSAEQPGVGHPFPAIGWWSDSGGIGYYLSLYQNTPSRQESVMNYQVSNGLPLRFETKYIFKMQVRQNGTTNSSHYSFKVWPAGTSEPAAWNVEADGDLSHGSVILGAHRTDVSFGTITVNPLP